MRLTDLLACAAAAVLLLAAGAEGRANATGAFEVFKTVECEACTSDGDSIWCSSGTGYILNASLPKTYPNYDSRGNPIPGPYCWVGTFGAILDTKGNFTGGILGSKNWVYADLECNGMDLYYRQCILAADIATILFVIGSIVFVVCTGTCCVCFGLCKCGHETNELHCCWLMTCKTVDCCAPKVEVDSRIEDREVAATLTGKADDVVAEEEKEKKLTAKERLALRKKEMAAKRAAEKDAKDTVENPMHANSETEKLV